MLCRFPLRVLDFVRRRGLDAHPAGNAGAGAAAQERAAREVGIGAGHQGEIAAEIAVAPAHSGSVWRGGPISTGWNSTAAAIVHTSDSAISLPMLDVPGWFDSHRLPKAVAVVMALKITARVSVDCSSAVLPLRQAMM